jgi:hypothetical protein
VISTLAFWTASSAVLSIARYNFLSPSGGANKITLNIIWRIGNFVYIASGKR